MSADDQQLLERINEEIGTFEEKGDWKALSSCLAVQTLRTGGEKPILAFRRASGSCIDGASFLDAVAPSAARKTKITSITPEGEHIAIVRCLVEMNGVTYRNVRLFVRAQASTTNWRLLAWANEKV